MLNPYVYLHIITTSEYTRISIMQLEPYRNAYSHIEMQIQRSCYWPKEKNNSLYAFDREVIGAR
jgi:hypothetical protein